MNIARSAAGFLILCVLISFGCAERLPESSPNLAGTLALESGQEATPIDADRKEQLEANLRHQLRNQLGGQAVTVQSLEPSEFEGIDQGRFTVGQQSFLFLTSSDDTRFYVLATAPFNAGLSPEDMEAELAAEKVAGERTARERAAILEDAIADLPFRGRADAAVTIVEFSDFQCPYCGLAYEVVEEILAAHPNDVKFVYAHYPLDTHAWAMPSAIAAVCAANQSEVAHWALYSGFFENQDAVDADNVIERGSAFLSDTGIDMNVWTRCATDTGSDAYLAAAEAVRASTRLGTELGVSGTPGFFVNGAFLNGAHPLETFDQAIQEAKERGR